MSIHLIQRPSFQLVFLPGLLFAALAWAPYAQAQNKGNNGNNGAKAAQERKDDARIKDEREDIGQVTDKIKSVTSEIKAAEQVVANKLGAVQATRQSFEQAKDRVATAESRRQGSIERWQTSKTLPWIMSRLRLRFSKSLMPIPRINF